MLCVLAARVDTGFGGCWPFLGKRSLLARMNVSLPRICLRDLIEFSGGSSTCRATLRSLIGTLPAVHEPPDASSLRTVGHSLEAVHSSSAPADLSLVRQVP